MKNLSKILPIFFLLVACTEDIWTLTINAENVDGINIKSIIDLNGLEIGEVIEMDLASNGTVDIKCKISNAYRLPKDSKFYLKDLGLLNGKAIGVKLGSDEEKLKYGQTVQITPEYNVTIKDSLLNKLGGLFNKLNEKDKTDSLLYELRRLNENLEDLKLKLK